MPKTLSPEGYRSTMDQEDLSLIRIGYCILEDFELELLGLDARVDNPPLGRPRVYEESFEVGLRFLIFSFILELLRSYGIPLCVLTPNSIGLVMGFLAICFLDEV